jgi:N-acetylglucosamine malate deacetylase 1
MNPYRTFVADIAKAVASARNIPLGAASRGTRTEPPADAPRVLLFAPHPDDECIIGALALRLLHEAKMRVIDVAVTQGSAAARKQGRKEELENACATLGFEVATTAPGGLDRITPRARKEEPDHWSGAVRTIASILERERPSVVMMPHEDDWNGTHIGTHWLVMDALRTMPAGYACHVVETEFWHAMKTPNLMVASSEDDVADLVLATACHVVEVQRNPYHLSLPAFMQDNVRRGGELVGGQGGAAPSYAFASLYRVGRWQGGALTPAWTAGRFLAETDDPAVLFA